MLCEFPEATHDSAQDWFFTDTYNLGIQFKPFLEQVHAGSSTGLSVLHSHSRADALFSLVPSERLPREIHGEGDSLL